MKIKQIEHNGIMIAVIEGNEIIITDTGSALDLMATVRYETDHEIMPCEGIVIPKTAVVEEFFVLSSGIAGEILQKFVTYHFKLAIVGDYSCYTSKPLKDFIYESNKGTHIFFVETEAEAIIKIANT